MKRNSRKKSVIRGGIDWSGFLKDLDHTFAAAKVGVDLTNTTLPSGRFLHNPAKRRVKSASTWAQQQVDNAKASSADWLAGVQSPARDPVEAAKAAVRKWENNLAVAIKDGAYVKGLNKTSAAEVASIAAAVGTSAFEGGLEARRSKIQRVVNELQPLAQGVSDAIQALPDATDADREKRLLAARKAMIELGKRR